MKSRIYLIVLIIGGGILFLSAGTLLVPYTRSEELSNTRMNLAMRSIGHQLLLYSGNSTSRILPVKQVNSFTFQLEFQSPLLFISDTLVKVVERNLQQANLSSHYIVEVLSCNNASQIVYGYEFTRKPKVIVPCLGRTQPLGCYIIQVVILEDDSNPSQSYAWMFGLSMMALIGFVGVKYIRKEKNVVAIVNGDFIKLGKYSFYYDRRLLHCQNESIELSDKESRLLKIFANHQNVVVERDRLLKEVWEDDGVFVGRSLDVFVSKLRKKLQDDASLRIINIHGKGYKLETQVNLIYNK